MLTFPLRYLLIFKMSLFCKVRGSYCYFFEKVLNITKVKFLLLGWRGRGLVFSILFSNILPELNIFPFTSVTLFKTIGLMEVSFLFSVLKKNPQNYRQITRNRCLLFIDLKLCTLESEHTELIILPFYRCKS